MPHFSTRTIALVKRNVNAMLTESCTLQRETGATGTMGEPLHTFVNVATGVQCRVIRAKTPNASSQMVVGSQESMVELYRLICPVGTAFLVDDRIVMSDLRTFQVVSVEDGLTDEGFAGAVITRVRT